MSTTPPWVTWKTGPSLVVPPPDPSSLMDLGMLGPRILRRLVRPPKRNLRTFPPMQEGHPVRTINVQLIYSSGYGPFHIYRMLFWTYTLDWLRAVTYSLSWSH